MRLFWTGGCYKLKIFLLNLLHGDIPLYPIIMNLIEVEQASTPDCWFAIQQLRESSIDLRQLLIEGCFMHGVGRICDEQVRPVLESLVVSGWGRDDTLAALGRQGRPESVQAFREDVLSCGRGCHGTHMGLASAPPRSHTCAFASGTWSAEGQLHARLPRRVGNNSQPWNLELQLNYTGGFFHRENAWKKTPLQFIGSQLYGWFFPSQKCIEKPPL